METLSSQDQTRKRTKLTEVVEIQPRELHLNHRKLARQRLDDALSKRKNIMQIHNVVCTGLPEVMRSTGALQYTFECDITVFEPQVGEIAHAKVVAILKIGIKLMVANMMCVLSEIMLKERKVTVDEPNRTFTYNNHVYRLGDVVPVKVLSLQKRIMDEQEMMLAYVTLCTP
jgi:DNA-directed RNA polymerase subunit E'/Rpb7